MDLELIKELNQIGINVKSLSKNEDVIVNPKLSHIINLKMSHLSMC